MYLGRVLGGLFGVRMVKRGGSEGWARVLESPGTSGESINEKRKGSGKREKREIEREREEREETPLFTRNRKGCSGLTHQSHCDPDFQCWRASFCFRVCLSSCLFLPELESIRLNSTRLSVCRRTGGKKSFKLNNWRSILLVAKRQRSRKVCKNTNNREKPWK